MEAPRLDSFLPIHQIEPAMITILTRKGPTKKRGQVLVGLPLSTAGVGCHEADGQASGAAAVAAAAAA